MIKNNSKVIPKCKIQMFSDFLSIPENPEDLFTLDEKIGKGSFGTVYKAIHKASKMTVAVKIISCDDLNQASPQKEISIMKLCDESDYIVKYYGSYFSKKNNEIWIILEYCDCGSAADFMLSIGRPFKEIEIASIIEMILEGLTLMHDKNLIHRDIKGANILLNIDGYAKLGDFGVGVQLDKDELRSSRKGTPYWMSPQVVTNSKYDCKTDIWSLGITCIELATGQPPLGEYKPYHVMNIIAKNPPRGLPEGKNFSKEFNDFVSKCLSIKPSDRPSSRELIRSDFIRKFSHGREFIKKLVQDNIEEVEDYRIEINESDESTQKDILQKDILQKDKKETLPVIDMLKTEETPREKKAVNTAQVEESNGNSFGIEDFQSFKNGESFVEKKSQDELNGSCIVREDNENNCYSSMVEVDDNNSRKSVNVNQEKKDESPEFMKYINNGDFIFDEQKLIEVAVKNKLNELKEKNSTEHMPTETDKTLPYESNTFTNKRRLSILRKFRNQNLIIGNMSNGKSLKNLIGLDKKGNFINLKVDEDKEMNINDLAEDKTLLNSDYAYISEKLRELTINKEYEMNCINAKYSTEIQKYEYALNLLQKFPNLKSLKEYEDKYQNTDGDFDSEYDCEDDSINNISTDAKSKTKSSLLVSEADLIRTVHTTKFKKHSEYFGK